MLFVTCSCKLSLGDQSQNQGDGSSGDSDTNNAEVVLIIPSADSFIAEQASSVVEKFYHHTGDMLSVKRDTDSEKGLAEIVMGKTSRDISTKAYERLENKLRSVESEDPFTQAFLIRVDGNSVAIAYDEMQQDKAIVLEQAVECLLDNMSYSDGILSAKEREIFVVCNALEYQETKDEAFVEAKWTELAQQVGGGEVGVNVVEAMKRLYSIYDDSVVDWCADLYDIETGGFYNTNSGRNSVSIFPSLEATYQILTFLVDSGMIEKKTDIPEEMQKQIVNFVKNSQDPDGYFYHPHWGKDLASNSRRGRDLDWATYLLKTFGAKPYYDTVTGLKGEGVPTSKIGGALPLGLSPITAVSKVIACASHPDYLESDVTFKEYLKKFDLKNDSYSAGNELSTTITQIRARDRELKASGASYSLCDILIDWLNENCNASTGHWSGVNNYAGTNGLMKILCVYKECGVLHPYPEQAVKSALNTLKTDEAPAAATSQYNVWIALRFLVENITLYADPKTSNELIASIRETIINDFPAVIKATVDKLLLFIKDDGTFSSYPDRTEHFMQGLPVAIPWTNEGDVDGTYICTVGITKAIFRVMGWDYVPMYTESDWMRFKNRISELGPIIKDTSSSLDVTYYFDDESWCADQTTFTSSSEGEVAFEDGQMHLLSNTNLYHVFSAKYPKIDTVLNANIFVMEGDFTFNILDESKHKSDMNKYVFHFGSVKDADMPKNPMEIFLSGEKNTVRLFGANTITIGEIGEKLHIRVEIAPRDERKPCNYKIFVNEKEVYNGSPNSYCPANLNAFNAYGYYIEAMKGLNSEIVIDNLKFSKEYAEYAVYIPEEEVDGSGNGPTMPLEQYLYTFDADFNNLSAYPGYDDKVFTAGGMNKVRFEDGKLHLISQNSASYFRVRRPNMEVKDDATMFVVEGDFTFNILDNELHNGGYYEIFFGNESVYNRLVFYVEDTVGKAEYNYIRIGNTRDYIVGKVSEEIHLRIEVTAGDGESDPTVPCNYRVIANGVEVYNGKSHNNSYAADLDQFGNLSALYILTRTESNFEMVIDNLKFVKDNTPAEAENGDGDEPISYVHTFDEGYDNINTEGTDCFIVTSSTSANKVEFKDGAMHLVTIDKLGSFRAKRPLFENNSGATKFVMEGDFTFNILDEDSHGVGANMYYEMYVGNSVNSADANANNKLVFYVEGGDKNRIRIGNTSNYIVGEPGEKLHIRYEITAGDASTSTPCNYKVIVNGVEVYNGNSHSGSYTAGISSFGNYYAFEFIPKGGTPNCEIVIDNLKFSKE